MMSFAVCSNYFWFFKIYIFKISKFCSMQRQQRQSIVSVTLGKLCIGSCPSEFMIFDYRFFSSNWGWFKCDIFLFFLFALENWLLINIKFLTLFFICLIFNTWQPSEEGYFRRSLVGWPVSCLVNIPLPLPRSRALPHHEVDLKLRHWWRPLTYYLVQVLLLLDI